MYPNVLVKVSVIALNLLISISFGQVVTNDTDNDPDSLRDVLATAVDNDIVTFAANLSGRTINLLSDLPQIAADNLTIDASGLAQPVTINANGNRLLSHTGNGTLTLRNVVLTGGTGTNVGGEFFGGGVYSAGDIVIEDSIVRNNEVAQDGGGLFSGRNMTIRNSRIIDNRTADDGAGAYSEVDLTVEDSTISNNIAEDAINDNSGGGLAAEGVLQVTNSTISGNRADDGGGVDARRNVTIVGSTLTDNRAEGTGGGVRSRLNGRVTITDSTLAGNQAVTGDGGAIFSERPVDIIGSVLSNNQSGDDGGAIFVQPDLEITSSSITGNQADDNGGGIHANRNVTISNSLIAGNVATDRGGGLRNNSNRDVTLINTTVAGNRANVAGGGLWLANNIDLILNNTLMLGNAAGTDDQVTANPVRITNNNSATAFAELTLAVDITQVFVNPQAPASAPTTAGDYRLLTDSPAIDAGDDALAVDPAGNPLTVDLAGNPRFQNTVDIGAYEGGFERSGGGSVINPNQDVQIRNGATVEAESITSGAIEPFYYGPYKRNEAVVLELLVRNPGAKVLELGELILPSFLSPVGEPLPETLNTFESALLSLQVDTSQAGRFTGEISLESNDPDAFENPFTFDIVMTVTDTPANALEVLPGAVLEDITVTPGQQDVPVYSFRLNVPAGSVPVTLDAITLNVDGMTALDNAKTLTLYLDGGIRGERDRLDVSLATLTAFDNEADTVTFSIPVRTLSPDVPLWFLVVADFE